jgi:hypothetical protein
MKVCCAKSHRSEWVEGDDEDSKFRGASDVVVKEAASSCVVQLGIC